MKKTKFSVITGVAGTIGSNLAKSLIESGHIVYGIDDFSLGKKSNINFLKKLKNFKLIKCDVSNHLELKKKIILKKKIDYLWLLAANSDIQAGIKDRNIDLNKTFMTTKVSLDFFNRYLFKKSKIIFSSSSAVYGNLKKKINEDIRYYNPISSYGECKLLSEIYLEDFSKKKKLKYLIIRFPNVVGSPLTHGVIFDFCKKILNQKYLKVLGNGNQKKPYVYVQELISCMLFLINKKTKFNLYLCGPNDKGVEVKKIADEVVKVFKSKKKIIYGKTSYGWKGDVPNYHYNVSRLNKEGFKFRKTSFQAVKEAIKENKLSLTHEKN